jgi:alkylation response protein AidB-like acyl-CoA dehydrogenase
MDFTFSPEQDAFRARLRQWLRATKAEIWGDTDEPVGGLEDAADDARWARLMRYHRALHDAGYVALHWPRQWGGAGAGLVEQVIYQDEVLAAGLPLYGANIIAIDRVGPTLIALGSDQQRKRYLGPMLTGEEIWCQGYSEPNAGSDLASLATRAEVRPDKFIVNGQKVWTSLANRAHMQVLLVRTDPHAPKHKGISYLIVDMRSPGITVRPLVQMTGEAGFNEIFYDNLEVPRENLVGELNGGWQVSLATLMYERISGGARHPVERMLEDLIALAREVSFEGMIAARHPYVRQRLAQFAIEVRCLRLTRYRALTAMMREQGPGPESSFGKLAATELNLHIQLFASELLGPYAQLAPGAVGALQNGRWLGRILSARANTIAAGSSEIQRNIIGERVLGLPKG